MTKTICEHQWQTRHIGWPRGAWMQMDSYEVCARCGTVRDQTERAKPAVNENAMNRIDMFGGGQIDWHPVIYEKGESPLSVLRVSLMHVRAANDIDIEYSSERDGWVIYQDVTLGWNQVENVMQPIEERREKAFIPAWDAQEVFEN